MSPIAQTGVADASSMEQVGDDYTDPFYVPWVKRGSELFQEPSTYGAGVLRDIYPKHSLVLFRDKGGSRSTLLDFPDAEKTIASPPESVFSLTFQPRIRRIGMHGHQEGASGTLVKSAKYGCYNVKWNDLAFILYSVEYSTLRGDVRLYYLLHEGPEEPSHALLLAANKWGMKLHDEILVFEMGHWREDRDLWQDVQKASWDDVILKEEFKESLRTDIDGFWEAGDVYSSLSIPWKRGIIMAGPPGNGKTISVKAVMKDCYARGYAPLYVKSFKHGMGEEYCMGAVFQKAREMAPCMLVLEDLDSLINNQNRSFFLNQVDGLVGNDGLLLIASTNHFEKLDPALSGRPSRFDRKYSFDDPGEDERALYAKYWQNKLRNNLDISFPDALVAEIAALTSDFSFAYLKEAFVSTLVVLATGAKRESRASFATVIKDQIHTLREHIKNNLREAVQDTGTKDIVHAQALLPRGFVGGHYVHAIPAEPL